MKGYLLRILNIETNKVLYFLEALNISKGVQETAHQSSALDLLLSCIGVSSLSRKVLIVIAREESVTSVASAKTLLKDDEKLIAAQGYGCIVVNQK